MNVMRKKIGVCALAAVAIVLILIPLLHKRGDVQQENIRRAEEGLLAKEELGRWMTREGRKCLRSGRRDSARDYAVIASLFGNENDATLLKAACDRKNNALYDFMSAEIKEAKSIGDVGREMRARNFARRFVEGAGVK